MKKLMSRNFIITIVVIILLATIGIAQNKEYRLFFATFKEQATDITTTTVKTPANYDTLYKLAPGTGTGNWKSMDSSGVLTLLNDNQHPQFAKVKSVTLGVGASTLVMTDADMVRVTADGGGNTITSITGAAPGRTIKIEFTGSGASITDQTNIQLAGGTTITGAANKVVVFTCFTGSVWQMQSVSAN